MERKYTKALASEAKLKSIADRLQMALRDERQEAEFLRAETVRVTEMVGLSVKEQKAESRHGKEGQAKVNGTKVEKAHTVERAETVNDQVAILTSHATPNKQI